MDKISLVNKLRIMSNKIIEDYQRVNLIMLLGNTFEQRTTSFDYIISANWLNEYDQEKGMDLVLDYLYDNLTGEDIEHISRVTIIHTQDPIVQNITSTIGMKGGFYKIIDCQFGNLTIPYAIIFESHM
ncbi:hypothetical protein AB9M92_01950 [Peribacillus frigoritolerans]|uniref:hypothetical protein n=1 Tax=Peribacillus frigoritolerans TaxID=450367 RepID=UPI003518EE55